MTEPAHRAFASPMGRYDSGEPAPGSTLHEIRLVGVPVQLFLATRQQHDDLMREFAVLALAHQDQRRSDPPELRRLVQELGAHSAAAPSRPDVEEAAREGASTVDLTFRVPESVLAAVDRFQALMRSADGFCAQGLMLTMPRSARMRRFEAWWFDEMRRQIAGHPPTPWDAAG